MKRFFAFFLHRVAGPTLNRLTFNVLHPINIAKKSECSLRADDRIFNLIGFSDRFGDLTTKFLPPFCRAFLIKVIKM